MAKQQHLTARFPKHGLRWLAILAFVVLIVLAAVARHVTRPDRLAQITADLLHQITGTDVTMEQAQIQSDGTIRLTGVTLQIPAAAKGARKFFSVEEIIIRHNILSLFKRRFEPQSLIFIHPLIYLTQDLKTKQFNYEVLREQRLAASPQLKKLNLPDITVRNGRLILSELENNKIQTIGHMDLSGQLNADLQLANIYHFNFRQRNEQGNGPTISGQIDLDKVSIKASLQGLTLDQPQRNVLPHDLRLWWDRLEPSGSFPNIKLGYDADPKAGLYAIIDVADVSLTLPFTKAKARMTVRSGRFIITKNLIKVVGLIGEVEGFTYTVNGSINGFSEDAVFSFATHIVGDILQEPRYMPWFPEKVQRIFSRFSPQGRFKAMILIRRDKQGQPLTYDGQLHIQDAKIKYWRFPYQLTHVAGELRFNDQEVRIVNLHGRGPTNALLNIHGRINPPKPSAHVDLTISSQELPIDRELYQALTPNQQRFFNKLFNPESYQRLTDSKEGIISSTAQHKKWKQKLAKIQKSLFLKASNKMPQRKQLLKQQQQLNRKLKRPIFDLGGKVAMLVKAQRAFGEHSKHRNTATYQVQGVNMLLKDFRYPLLLTAGQLVVSDTQVRLENIKFKTLSGTRGTIRGTYKIVNDNGNKYLIPNVHFTAIDVPIDELLLHAMPDTLAATLRKLDLQGFVDVGGVILPNKNLPEDAHKPNFIIEATVHHASIRPNHGRYVINQIAGPIIIKPHQVLLRELNGRHGQAAIRLTGQVNHQLVPQKSLKPVTQSAGQSSLKSAIQLTPQQNIQTTYDLVLSARQLKFEDPVLDILSEHNPVTKIANKLYDAHKPKGIFNATWHLQKKADNSQIYHLALEPKSLAFTLNGQLVAMDQIDAKVLLDDQGLHFQKWQCQYSHGQFNATGDIQLTPTGTTFDFSFEANNDSLCPITRSVLPPSVLATLDAIDLQGAYYIRHGKISYHPNAKNTPPLILDANIELINAKAMIGLPITELNGTLKTHVTCDANKKPINVRLNFVATELRAAGRRISPLTAVLTHTPEQPGRYDIKQITGNIYNGTLYGNCHLQTSSQTQNELQYQARLTLQNVDLTPLIHDTLPPSTKDPSSLPYGKLAADLTISGTPQNIAMRQGRGIIQIKDTSLYQIPVAMAMLQLLNFSPPTSKSFDSVRVQYILEGDTVRFDPLRFESPTIDVVGTGEMQYSTQKLNLKMVTSNRAGAKLGPLSDLLKVFKDELVGIQVTGTLDEPNAKISSLKGIRHAIGKVFGQPSK